MGRSCRETILEACPDAAPELGRDGLTSGERAHYYLPLHDMTSFELYGSAESTPLHEQKAGDSSIHFRQSADGPTRNYTSVESTAEGTRGEWPGLRKRLVATGVTML